MTDVSRQTESFSLEAQIEERLAGRRGKVRHGGTLCSNCYANPPHGKDKYCLGCRRAYRRAHPRRKKTEP